MHVGLTVAQRDHAAFGLEESCTLTVQCMDRNRLPLFMEDNTAIPIHLEGDN